MHPFCSGGGGGSEALSPSQQQSQMVLAALLDEAASGSVSAVRSLRMNFAREVLYNEERAALQLRGCSDEVIVGNIPLTDSQTKAISTQ